MNIQEQVELLNALYAVGATHYKSNDFEVTLTGSTYSDSTYAQQLTTPSKEETLVADSPVVINKENTEKAQELISTLKMSPEELANHMFPDGAL